MLQSVGGHTELVRILQEYRRPLAVAFLVSVMRRTGPEVESLVKALGDVLDVEDGAVSLRSRVERMLTVK